MVPRDTVLVRCNENIGGGFGNISVRTHTTRVFCSHCRRRTIGIARRFRWHLFLVFVEGNPPPPPASMYVCAIDGCFTSVPLAVQDRAHRIGQTREVHIYRLVTSSSIEENILKKAQQKRHLDFLGKTRQHAHLHACMHGCMDACMHGCMDAWMHGCKTRHTAWPEMRLVCKILPGGCTVARAVRARLLSRARSESREEHGR